MNAPWSGLVFAGILLGACAPSLRSDDHLIVETAAQGELAGRSTLSMPIPLPGHSTCLVPFSIEERKGIGNDKDPFTRGPYSSYRHQTFVELSRRQDIRWHNAVVHDTRSGEEWLLLEGRGVISEWHSFGRAPRPGEPVRCDLNVFLATVEDTNGDGLLDDRDACVAIVAEGDARRPRAVSGPAAQVWDVLYDPDGGRLYLNVVRDTNRDGRFDTADAPEPYHLDPRTETAARPVVSQESLTRMHSLLR